MMKNNITGDAKLIACLADLESMIKRTKLLCAEFSIWRKLPREQKIDTALMENSIAFSEIQDLDLRCSEALEEASPETDHNWYVNESSDVASPEDMLTHLMRKKTTLSTIMDSLGINISSAGNEEKEDDVLILKPSLFGLGVDLKVAWKKFRKIFKKGQDDT